MKRVLVLNADSFVGREVCRCFFDAKEYLIDGTLYHGHSGRGEPEEGAPHGCDGLGSVSTMSPPSATASTALLELGVPADMRPFLNSVMPRHGEISDEQFRARVLTYDIIIAILEEDAFEADCTIKVLRGTHYEVEKTFVLVSNVLTWTQTDAHEHELRRAARRAEREAARAQRAEDGLSEEEEEEEEEKEEEEMEQKVWTEEDYRQRYPDARYHLWKELEHAVKHANSETLHTYVLWAGLPYGGGEDLLAPYFHAAWRHQEIFQYGDGLNHIPTIHVKDLARIIYLVGSSYDTLDERYMFAVDQGNNTQADILQGVKEFIGGVVSVTAPEIDRKNQVVLPGSQGKEGGKGLRKGTALEENIVHEHDVLKGLRLQEAQLVDEIGEELLKLRELERREGQRQSEGGLQEREADAASNHVSEPGEASTPKASLTITPPHGLANWFSAVDVRCEPGAVLSLLEEEEWVSLGGFFANVDKIVQEFKVARQLRPMRLVLSGPPLSRVGEVAGKLAELFNIPHLTLANVTAAYEEHVGALREELVEILLRRKLRRYTAREERRRREAERAKKARRKARNEEGEEGEEGEEEEEEGEEGEEEEEEVAGEDGEEEEEDEGEEGEEEAVDPAVRLRAAITEAMLLQKPEDEDEEEEEDDSNYNADDDDEEEVDEKAAAMARQVDEAERRRIATLREEYRFATELLTLRLVNGEFPRQPEGAEEEEEEEELEEDEDDDDYGRRRKRREQKEEAEADATETPPPTIRYFDEVMAVMVRWRLRQEDCRNQGYILEDFPETVRQAWLTFLADSEEKKEMQRPKLQKDRDEEAEPQPPLDATFPLPVLADLEEDQRREMMELMTGRRFTSAEEALAPTHDAFFPDCFIALTGNEVALRAQIDAATATAADGDTKPDFSEQFTRYMTHNRPGGPPTESLVCWFQTVAAEKLDDDRPDAVRGEGGEVREKVPRKACVLLVPVISTCPKAMLPKFFAREQASDMELYCIFIRSEILKNIGLGSCGPVMESMQAEAEANARHLQELALEKERIEKLNASNEACAMAAKKMDDDFLANERRVLRYYQAKEELASIAGIDSIPVDVYLMRYVLPSLTPLMAEVVRMRPEDPVTVLADALFHHKRQVKL